MEPSLKCPCGTPWPCGCAEAHRLVEAAGKARGECPICRHAMATHGPFGCENINKIFHPMHGAICGCPIGTRPARNFTVTNVRGL